MRCKHVDITERRVTDARSRVEIVKQFEHIVADNALFQTIAVLFVQVRGSEPETTPQ